MFKVSRLIGLIVLALGVSLAGCKKKDQESGKEPEPGKQNDVGTTPKPGETKGQGSGVAPDSGPQKDSDLIQGRWALEWAQVGGKKQTATRGEAIIVFKGDKMIAKGLVNFLGEGDPLLLALLREQIIMTGQMDVRKFQLDPTKRPKAIDTHIKENPNSAQQGIYELNGDQLKMCFIRTPKADRPAKFENPGNPDSMVCSFKRDNSLPPLPEETEADFSRFPAAIVGKWELVRGETIFPFFRDTEFTADGRVLQFDRDNKPWVEKYKYRFDTKYLVLIPLEKGSSEEGGIRVEVTQITDDKFVSRRPSGELKRVK